MACVTHANEIAPPGYATSTQGTVSATYWGLGFAVGGVGGGFVDQAVGANTLFFIASGVALGGLVLGILGLLLCNSGTIEKVNEANKELLA